MAHKKGVGSTDNGRDSKAQRLGVKLFGGQYAIPGNIIIRQRGTRYRPGVGVGLGKDHTIYALVEGTVTFRRKIDNRVYVNVMPPVGETIADVAVAPVAKKVAPIVEAPVVEAIYAPAIEEVAPVIEEVAAPVADAVEEVAPVIEDEAAPVAYHTEEEEAPIFDTLEEVIPDMEDEAASEDAPIVFPDEEEEGEKA